MAKEIRLVATESGLNVRAEPTIQSDIVTSLPDGIQIAVERESATEADDFTWLQLADRSGWVVEVFTTLVKPPTEFRMIKVDGNLNIRSAPTTQEDNVVDRLPDGSIAEVVAGETVEANDYTWLRLADGTGWIVAGYTELIDEPVSVAQRGINIDLNAADTSPDDLSPFRYCRFTYDLSQNTGNENFNKVAAFDAKIEHYIAQGVTPIVVFNHEFYGEGKFVWGTMQDDSPGSLAKWDQLINRFSELLAVVAERFGDRIVYEIWNEPDQKSVAAVQIPAAAFGKMLDKALDTILAFAPKAQVIVGGLVSGQPSYWKATQDHMQNAHQLAGIGLHPYGRGGRGKPAEFEDNGTIHGLLNVYHESVVQKFWLTEWGVLGDATSSNPPDVSEDSMCKYLKRFLTAAERDPRIKATVYFPLKDGMHNGYGLSCKDNTPKKTIWKAISE